MTSACCALVQFEAAFAYDAVNVLVESIKYLHDQSENRDPFADLFSHGFMVTGANCRKPKSFKYGDDLMNAIIQVRETFLLSLSYLLLIITVYLIE